ncbi:MAG TPA: head GIN domain-containing protein [Niabella sp.]|nr:head GIN domain-containing protein [Niabella sp.]
MKKLFTIIALLAIVFVHAGCEKVSPVGPVVNEKRSVSSFNKIELRFDANVIFTHSGSKSVEVEASQNIQSLILTEVNGSTLVLKTLPNTKIDEGDVTIYISNPSLSGINLNGNGEFTSETGISGATMNIRVNGNGNVNLKELTAHMLDADISGNGGISINTGTVLKQDVKVSGNGSYRAEYIESNEASVKITGNAGAWIWVSEKLNAVITGSGNIWYKGAPVINSTITGSGKVKPL